MSSTSAAPYEEPAGFISAPGFVKNNPLNNDHYIEQFKDHPWYSIILYTHRELTELIPGYNIAQIKEKFGGLRYYIDYPDPIPVGTLPWNDTEEKVMRLANQIISNAEYWVEGFECARAQRT